MVAWVLAAGAGSVPVFPASLIEEGTPLVKPTGARKTLDGSLTGVGSVSVGSTVVSTLFAGKWMAVSPPPMSVVVVYDRSEAVFTRLLATLVPAGIVTLYVYVCVPPGAIVMGWVHTTALWVAFCA